MSALRFACRFLLALALLVLPGTTVLAQDAGRESSDGAVNSETGVLTDAGAEGGSEAGTTVAVNQRPDCSSAASGLPARHCACGQQAYDLLVREGVTDDIELNKLGPNQSQDHWCWQLADLLIDFSQLHHDSSLAWLRNDALASAQAPPLPDESAGVQGGTAQTAAAPSVEPVQFASETISLGYAQSGGRLLLAASVNPLSSLARSNPSSAFLLMRLLDIGVQLPINIQGLIAAPSGMAMALPAPWSVLENFGVRVRLNFLANTSQLQHHAERIQAYANALDTQTSVLQSRLEDLSVPLDVEAALRAAYHDETTGLATELATVQALRGYFGLDGRVDTGDPTFSQRAASLGVTSLVSLAGGLSYRSPNVYFGLRGRLGWSMFHPIVVAANDVHSFDWAAGLTFGWSASFYIPQIGRTQSMELSAGFEGRHGNGATAAMTDVGVTNTVALRASFNLPLTAGGSAGIGLSVPVSGSGPTLITLSGNLAQLLGAPRETPIPRPGAQH